jgi:hypothetical protein
VTAAVTTGDGEQPRASSVVTSAAVQASCRDWVASSHGDDLPDDQWCTDMFAWMGDRSGGSMMHSTMWRSPARMGGACRDWVDRAGAGRAAGRRARCTDMVEWMDAHLSDQGGTWMMRSR